jgi:hypothetical protein
MMNLDDFADYRVSTVRGKDEIYLRHSGCSHNFVEKIELGAPLAETNLKWLMLQATLHWQEAHQDAAS